MDLPGNHLGTRRAGLSIQAFIRSLRRDPLLAHIAKIEPRATSPTPQTHHRESHADDPHERRDDDPAGHE